MARGSHYVPSAIRVQPKVQKTFILDRSRMRQQPLALDVTMSSLRAPKQAKASLGLEQKNLADTHRLQSDSVNYAQTKQSAHRRADQARRDLQPEYDLECNRSTVISGEVLRDRAQQIERLGQEKVDSSACRYHKKSFRILYTFGMCTFAVALFASFHTVYTNVQTKDQVAVLGETTNSIDETGVAEGTSDEPSEELVSDGAMKAYSVGKSEVRYIRIPSLRVNARVKSTGLDAKGAIEAPRNINDVNWYEDSVVPGSSVGTSLLVGHLSGWTAPGVFKKLDKLKPGDTIELERGDGKKILYSVERTETAPVEDIDISKVLATDVPDTHMLKLMTCAGAYDSKSDSFKERTIVYAIAE